MASIHSGVTLQESRVHRQAGVLAQEAQGQTVLLRVEDGGYYALDEVGARIWELCDGQNTISEMVAQLCLEFDAPQDTIRADLLDFVDELRREQLLVVESG